jgi:hypothetical protein
MTSDGVGSGDWLCEKNDPPMTSAAETANVTFSVRNEVKQALTIPMK